MKAVFSISEINEEFETYSKIVVKNKTMPTP